MFRTRAVGFLLILCIAGLGWHLLHRAPAATPSVTPISLRQPSPPPTTTPIHNGTRTAESPATAPTGLAVTPQPPEITPVQTDVPQDSRAGPRPAAPGPGQRQVEAEEPPADQVSDTQLQTALERQTAGQARLQPDLEHDAAAAAWQQVQAALTAANAWTDIEQRAAVALLIGQHSDPTRPVPVNVITTWSGTDTEGVLGVHRTQTKLLYVDDTWRPVN